MAEYIERSSVLKNQMTVGICDAYGKEYGSADVVLVDDIKAIPAVDVAPVLHGRWFDPESDDGGYEWHCSCCGFPVRVLLGPPGYRFCPGCGARMDVGTE